MKNIGQKLSIATLVLLSILIPKDLCAQLRIEMDNAIVSQGETVCVDLVVEGFDDLAGLLFGVSWDPNSLEFQEIANLDPVIAPGVMIDDSDKDQGGLGFNWLDAAVSGRSLPDGQIIFSVCFTVIGEQGTDSKVRIVGVGDGAGRIEVVNSVGNDVPFAGATDAEIYISFEEVPDNALILYYDDIDLTQGGDFCVPIRVRNFVQIVDLQFSMLFNTERFVFNGIPFKEQDGGNWDVTVRPNDELQILYQGLDFSLAAEGLDLNDGDIIFEICFTHLLDETCVNEKLELSANPLAILASQLNEPDPLPVVFEAGRIRLQTPIRYNGENITPVTCAQPNIGSISVNADRGTDGIKYLWSTGETSNMISNLTAGTYEVSISDICLAVDTVFQSFVVEIDGEMPMANAGDDVLLECGNSTVALDGSSSSSGASFSYAWSGLDGQSIISGSEDIQAQVNQGGRFELVVTNEESGCSSRDTVEVMDVRTLPEVMAGEDVMLDCDDVTIDLLGTGDNGINYDYIWTTEDGNIVEQISKGGIRIDAPGTYIFRITDRATQCTGIDELIVTGDNVKPDVNIVGSAAITCDDPELTLAAYMAEESGVSYTWRTANGSIVSGADAFNVVIDGPGTYTVAAVNDISGCTSDEDDIVVIDRRTSPAISTSDNTMIGCDDDDITLSGSGGTGEGFQLIWSTDDGSIISQTPEGQAVVNSSGTYTFTVTETANGCAASKDVIVTGDNERPLAAISGMTVLDCTTSTLSLNANNGGDAIPGYTYEWSTMDGSIVGGATEVNATIAEPGTYTVKVTNEASMCSNNATRVITSEAEEPEISSSNDESIDCSTEVKTLTVTSGDDISSLDFQWNVLEGDGQVISGSTSSEVQVMGAGDYEIVVTNSFNGCSIRDTITVSLNASLEEARIGVDYDHCESETIVMGNQPESTTGQWTVINGQAQLEDPLDSNCRVNSLSTGINTFVWTLSSAGCPDYSSDTININFIPPPVAVADFINVTQGFGSVDIDLLSNDQFSPESGATINLFSEPSLGLLMENDNGMFTYRLDNPNAFGVFSFEYELCDDICSLKCDIGTVTIDVRDGSLPPRDSVSLQNAPISLGITPNGDGLNDELVFDELIRNQDDYKTKRLIVYNRWGDIVHESQPYNNDWGGTSPNGSALPQGTYYFVMQLDLGQGAIIEGDVTILK